jgi:glycosyltransferase involved in cell wall biosynthesis
VNNLSERGFGISVIIVSHNREVLLRRAVDSVRRATAGYLGELEIIVINSSSRMSFADDPSVKEVFLPMMKKAAAKRNVGLRIAKYDWLIFMDDDCEMHASALQKVSTFALNATNEVGGFYGITEFQGEKRFPLCCCIGTDLTGDFSWASYMKELPWGPTSLAAFRKELLIALGGFDETMNLDVGGEDVDLGMRINKAGFKLISIPFILAYHESATWNSFNGNLKRFYRYGKADSDLQIRHPDCVYFKIDSIAIILVSLAMAMIIYRIFYGNVLSAIVVFASYAAISSLVSLVIYHHKFKKMPLESLGLRMYDLSFAFGSFLSSLRRCRTKQLFFQSNYNFPSGNRTLFGRDKLLCESELPDLIGVSLAVFFAAYFVL